MKPDISKSIEIERTIKNSQETIDMFQTSIELSTKRNEYSQEKIEQWESQLTVMKQHFFDVNNITYEKAIEHVNASKNPEAEFNLSEYWDIKKIEDKISGEKFFIYQREKIIANNKKIIEQIKQRIDQLQEINNESK